MELETLRPRVSWSAIFSGTVVAIGIWLLLLSLGLALGLSSIDPDQPDSLRGAGIGAGLWGIVVPLIALFVGGFIAAQAAGFSSRGAGTLHGIVLWGFATVIGIWVVTSVLAMIASGAARVGSGVAGAASAGSGGAQQGAQALGLDMNDVVAPINERLREEGKPEITPDQLQAATRDVVNDAVRTGRVDRELLVSSVAQHTNLTRADAEDVANRIDARIQEMRTQASGTAQQVQEQALGAAKTTGTAFWAIFGMLALGLVASVLGAYTGAGRVTETGRDRVRVTQEVRP